MNITTATCKNCERSFIIEEEDVAFYEKMHVPAPTWCPDCRMQRRMAFRNERTLYKRTCDLCKKNVIGVYPSDVAFPVYCQECWWSDAWDPLRYGREFDFGKTFFEQYEELQNSVPRQHTNNAIGTSLLDSPYTNCSGDLKKCYLLFGSAWNEDCLYSHYVEHSKNCADILYGIKSENCYECFDIESCYGLRFSQSCLSCRDGLLLFDCRNCTDCIGCIGLRNKQYHIFNRPYTKTDYVAEKEKLALHTRAGLQQAKEKCQRELFPLFPRKCYHGQMNSGFSGDYISNCEKTHQSFYTKNARGSKFCYWCINALDVHDYFAWGDVELCYECVSGGYNHYRCKFTETSWSDHDVEYCGLCMTSSDLFGCVGLRNKRFCILNKQYEESAYRALKDKIIRHMNEQPYRDALGNQYPYGEFFPTHLSTFPYRDSVAQEHFPLDKEEIVRKGYAWREPDVRMHEVTKSHRDLPQSIKETADDITGEVISCANSQAGMDTCTGAYKIVPQELMFYREMNIPLPMLCHNCRHAERVTQRNPLKLWKRTCACLHPASSGAKDVYRNSAVHMHGTDPCPNVFETSYAPERPEVIYCEHCYTQEVV